ncbi:hypothetical protein [Paraburkholderia elongata]|uniref:Myb-like domain-containing protein n=1 Tax=Paraburkholderia elongata TaxID=2675747 RepID=A0A972NTZ4_9BURK|nr:hypothetical protein [Paraburkholderia elongata]NPT59071.1 hypothetical protein [Paraburkholderia elongata]
MGGRLWTKEEDAILASFWKGGGEIVSHLSKLPGRTVDAAQIRARYLKLGSRYNMWTDEEDAVLRGVWTMGCSLKSQLHRLPNRTWKSALDRARVLGLPKRKASEYVSKYSWAEEVITRELERGYPMTARQIEARTPASYERATQILRAGHGTKYRISGWLRSNPLGSGCWTAIWAMGTEPDAPKPEKKPRSMQCREYRTRKNIASGKINPFAVAMNQVSAPTGTTGRVFKQDMVVHLRDEEIAA